MTEADSIKIGIHDEYEYLRVRLIIAACIFGSSIITCCGGLCLVVSDKKSAISSVVMIFGYLMVFACLVAGMVYTYILVTKNENVAKFRIVDSSNDVAMLGQIIVFMSIIIDYMLTFIFGCPIMCIPCILKSIDNNEMKTPSEKSALRQPAVVSCV
tara:strand:- start:30 stop:497 length:468 start_codon:yes stop_codon:yes gene_type:complete